MLVNVWPTSRDTALTAPERDNLFSHLPMFAAASAGSKTDGPQAALCCRWPADSSNAVLLYGLKATTINHSELSGMSVGRAVEACADA